jgi:tetratricopeptide (TPR) repeat protein
MMEKAAEWAQSAQVSPGERRGVWQRLAALEYQAGSLQAAVEHYRLVADNWNAPPPASAGEQTTALNNLAVLYLLQGQYSGAERALSQAVSKSLKTDSVYGRSLNNLGVLAELRGDRRKAEAFYTDALRAFAGISDSSEQDRRLAEANLARLKSSH